MRNKYMRRGVLLVIAGIGFTMLGYYIMEEQDYKYGWAMIAGVISFGVGFLLVLYSLIRKIDRRALLNKRAEEQEEQES